MDLDDIDIYDDLVDFGENNGDERCPKELRERIKELETTVILLEKQIQELQAIKATLEVNLSSLIKTAKTEISRKDRMIAELRQERDNTLFRRAPGQRPSRPGAQKVANSSSKAPKNVNRTSKNPPNVNAQHEVEITQSYPTKNPSNLEIDEDNDDKALPTDTKLPSTTVFGQRLQKKLQEEAEVSKKKLPEPQVELPASPDGEKHKNRDNKENRRNINAILHEIASANASKRAHVDELNGNSEKRRKFKDEGDKLESKSRKPEKDQKYSSATYDSTYFCSSDPRKNDRDDIERSGRRPSRESSSGTSSERRSSHSSRKNDSPVRHSSRNHNSHSKKSNRDHKSSRQIYSERPRGADLRDRITGSKSRPKEPSSDRRIDDKRRDTRNTDKEKNQIESSRSRRSKSRIVENERRKTRSRSRDHLNTRGKKYPHRPPSPPSSPPPPSPLFSPISPFSSPSLNKSREIPKIEESKLEKTRVSSVSDDRATENNQGKDEKKIPEEKMTMENDGLEEGEIMEGFSDDEDVDKNNIKAVETEKIKCDSSMPTLENYLQSTPSKKKAENIETEPELLENQNTDVDVEMSECKFNGVDVNSTPMKEEKIENIEAFIRNFDPEKCEQLDNARILNTTIDIAKNLEYEADDKEKYLQIEPEINVDNEVEAFSPSKNGGTTALQIDTIASREEKTKVLEINEKSREECVETVEWNFQDNEIGATVEISTDPDEKDETESAKISGEIATTLIEDKLSEPEKKVFSPPMVILYGKENLNCENPIVNDLGSARVEKIGMSTRQATKDSNKNVSSDKITLSDDNSNSNDRLNIDSGKNDDKEASPNLIIDETSQSKPDVPKTVRKNRKGAAATTTTTAKTPNTAENNEKQQKEKKIGVKKSQQNATQKSDVKVIKRKKFRHLSDDSSSVVLVVSEQKSDNV